MRPPNKSRVQKDIQDVEEILRVVAILKKQVLGF